MLTIKKGYARKYAYGGRGLFDTGLVGRVFTSSAAKSLGNEAMSAVTNAALKGVEKGATKAVDHVVDKVNRKHRKSTQQSFVQRNKPQQNRLNNLISGFGIKTVYDFVQRFQEIHYIRHSYNYRRLDLRRNSPKISGSRIRNSSWSQPE